MLLGFPAHPHGATDSIHYSDKSTCSAPEDLMPSLIRSVRTSNLINYQMTTEIGSPNYGNTRIAFSDEKYKINFNE